jgi:hypothetical protein
VTDEQLPHGFTLADIDATAEKAAYTTPWRQMAFRQRVGITQFAVVELLCTADDWPEFWLVIEAGQRAIHAYAVKELHRRGLVARLGDVPTVRCSTDWQAVAAVTESYEDRIVEAVAVDQILSTAPQRTDPLPVTPADAIAVAASRHRAVWSLGATTVPQLAEDDR